MNRQEKELVVADVRQKFGSAQAAFLVNYKGLPVHLMQALRKQIREADGSFKVTKARLMKIAAQDIPGSQDFSLNFKDQVGLVFVNNEVTVVAKKVVEFAKEHDALKIVAGFFEQRVITKAEVVALGSIPSRDILYATLVYSLQSPLINLVGTLEAKAKKDQEGQQQ